MGEGCGQGARSGCGGLKAGSAGGTPRTSLACPAVRPPASRPNSGTPGAPPGPVGVYVIKHIFLQGFASHEEWLSS